MQFLMKGANPYHDYRKYKVRKVMSDNIELVIRISKNVYDRVANTNPSFGVDFPIYYAVKNGKPLPKGHGKLVDVNSIPEEDRNITVKGLLHPGTIACAGAISLEEYLNELTTIVEADSNESGE